MLKTGAKIKLILLLLLVLAAAGGGFYLAFRLFAPASFETKRSLTLTILRSEDLQFLVTRRLASTVVLEKRENSVILGDRQGLLLADVEIYYGFDLTKIEASALSRAGDRVAVRLPEPEALTTTVKLDSMRFFSKQSGLSKLVDIVKSQDIEDELRQEFAAAAEAYFAARGMMPARAELVAVLNRWAGARFAAAGVDVVFE